MTARLAVAAVLTGLLVPAAAPAATTVGSTLPAWTGDTVECVDPGGCTIVPRTISGRTIAMPFDGVIVSWSARMPTTADTTALALKPLELTATGAQPAGAYVPLVPPTTDGAIVTRQTRMSVRAGDLIAVDLDNGDEIGSTSHALLDSLSWSFVPVLDADRAPDFIDSDDFEYLFNASVERDADHDGYGDDTQDKCPQLTAEYRRTCKGIPTLSVSAGHVGIGVVGVGKEIELQVRVEAPATELVAGGRIEVTLPDVLRPVRITGTATCSISGQRVVCPLGTIQPRLGYSANIQALALRPAITEFEGTATNLLGASVSAKDAVVITTGKRCGLRIPTAEGTERGTTGGDRIVGSERDDQLVGRAGEDCLRGEEGDDVLDGGDGNDRADGGPGADLLHGDAGDDRLIGGPGRDRIAGGPGNDLISAADGKRDVVRCGAGRDSARVDRLDSVSGCERVKPKR